MSFETSSLNHSLLRATLAGAKAARARQLAGLAPRQKSEDKDDLVTEGDEASQAAILALLPRVHEGRAISVLAEEKTLPADRIEGALWRWVIDPIDGTLPYSRGEAAWCVSIALQERAERWETRKAVIYRASAQDTAGTLHGLAFQTDGKEVLVHDLNSGQTSPFSRPAKVQAVAELSAAGAFGDWAAGEFHRRGIATGFRRSICYAVCEMLLGRKCAVVQDAGPLEWDVAAILPIARAAGAHVYLKRTDSVGNCDRYEVITAWDESLFKRFCEKMTVL